MKQQQQLTQKQYIKAWLKLLSSVANKPRRIFKAIDSYFFDEESTDIRPYFYGSLAFGILVTIAVYIITL